MLTNVDHIGVAVRSVERASESYRVGLDIETSPPEIIADQHVRVVFAHVGGTDLELLEPTEPTSSVGRFLAKRGEGLHHIAFAVPSVDRVLARLERQGRRVVDRVSRVGARGRRVGFAHPSAFGGVLVEFVEVP